MNNKLDNDIKNRIREVFDNYEDASADAGWQLLRKRFPVKKKERLVADWWYAAAALLLIGMGIWFLKPNNTVQVTYRTKKTISLPGADTSFKTPAGAFNGLKLGKKGDVLAHDLPKNNKLKADTVPAYKPQALSNEVIKSKSADVVTNIAPIEVKINTPGLNDFLRGQKIINNTTDKSVTDSIKAIGQQPLLTAKIPVFTGSGKALSNPLLKPDHNVIAQPANTSSTAVTARKDDAILKMFAEDMAKQSAVKNIDKKAPANKTVLLSAYAATYFNYAKGSSNEVNLGAGIMSDFKLSNNIRLSTGLALAQNTLNYSNSTIPQTLNQQVTHSISANLSRPALGFNSGLITYDVMVSGYNANLIGLDIPLNLKFLFNPQKSDTYISAGISSGTYVNETYRSTFSSGSSFLNTGVQQFPNQQTTESQHFNTFDIAKTLNVSFGIGYPIGKNRLIVEPFLKYPLGGLGSQDIRFGASGVNLKFSFSGSKK